MLNKKNIEAIYPLSPMQEGMLFHTLKEPDSGVYVEQMVLTIEGPMNRDAFKQSWQKLLERYAVLRTTFLWEQRQQPLQVVLKQVSLPWQDYNWKNLSPEEQHQRLEDLLQSDSGQGFDLQQVPLMRCTLIELGEEHYQFLWSHHHILLDGWCLPILLKEMLHIYDALNLDKKILLNAPRPYRDYIRWLGQQDWTAAKVFWQQTLAGFDTPTSLVVDRPRAVDTSKHSLYKKQSLRLSTSVTEQLQVLVKQHRLTAATLIQGAWAVLLSRYSSESEVLFGVTVSGRPAVLPGIEQMIGLFINTLPLRISVRNSQPLLSWLQQVQQALLAIQDYAYSPLVEVQKLSEVPAGTGLFESILVFENYPIDESLRQPDPILKVRNFPSREHTNYPLTVVGVSGIEMEVQISYDTQRFAAETITRMLGHLQRILEAMITKPEQPVGELPLLTEAEQHQLLWEWNDTYADYPQDMCIHMLFEQQVDRTPDAVAVVFGSEKLTYQQLNERANQLAHYLRSLGVGPEVLVGICVERSIEMVVGLLSILKAGGAYVPLDPAYPKERIAYILSDAQVPVLLTLSKLLDFLGSTDGKVVCLDGDWGARASLNEENPAKLASPENLAYVIYTSGSTGEPKGVEITHSGLLNLIFWHQRTFEVTTSDRTTQLAGTAFDACAWELWPSLTAGASIYLVNKETMLSPSLLGDWLSSKEITITFVPTPLAEKMLELSWSDKIALRIMLTGGDKLGRNGCDLVPFKLINNYGPTENTVVTTSGEVGGNDNSMNMLPDIGRPIDNTQVYILDSHLEPVPIGVPGELHIGGAGLARSYLNRPSLTLCSFIPHPFSDEPGARLYKTGDRARYRSDGKIEFLGRIDNQVKIRGFRIELGEIEATLAGHIKVRQTVVMAREDQPGDKRLVAYIVPDQTAPDAGELRQFLKGKLPDYMVPTAFVMLETIPLTPNGKIDRRALPAPDINALGSEAGFIAPRNTTELQLSQIWSEVLNIPAVGARDNFFDLGGHSLLAVRLMGRIKQQFGTDLPLATLFTKGTIEYQASLLSAAPNTQASSCLVPIKPMGSLPPFFCVHPGGGNVLCYADLARQLSVEQPFYGLQAVGINGEEKPLTRIEDMAATYIQAIQTVQPEGPYKLGGWCLGGFVAFEMARQLQASGYEIALLVIIQSFINPLELDEARAVMILAKYLILGQEQAVSVDEIRQMSEEIRQLELDEKLNYVRKKIIQIWPLEIELEQMRQLFAVLQAAEQAEHSYVFQPYPGEITFFYASEPPEELPEKQKQMQNWGSLASGGINIHKLPGDHYSIIRSEALAKALGLYLKGERNPIDH